MRKKQSMEEIYLENRHWVYGSFLRKTGEIETAEDLSQTLWLRFFQNYENLNLPNEKVVRAYLRSMILHAAADYWRSTQKAEDLMKELENLLEAENTGQDAVHAEAFLEDAIDDIEAAYRELSEEERIMLSLKYEGRCTSKEIGAVTTVTNLKIGDKVEISFKDKVTELAKEELDKQVKETVAKVKLKARLVKLKDGRLNITISGDVQNLQELGYAVKYKFYRSTRKAGSYNVALEKAGITFTTGKGTKGTRYYYKARLMVYDKEGKLIAKSELKQ